ncbi:AGAP013124-PA-like protein [Anopheles sinensis]|uniref:AGAP013124-PA-like protein n=1 Tax=Anopheles sinensis TaxID=74873 RepID=A0A084VTA4_ANOSI|nr:AGAP013124-PA-like protein [Anopheles sinensis]
MVVETQTDTGVEHSAEGVEVHQEQTPVVVAEESVEKLNASEHQQEQTEEVNESAVQELAPVIANEEPAQQATDAEVRTAASLVETEPVIKKSVEESTFTVSEDPVVLEKEVPSKPNTKEEEVPSEERVVVAQQEEPVVNDVHKEAPAPINKTADAMELPKFIYKAMEKVGIEQGFTPGQMKIEFDVGSNKGDGFVGEMFKAFLSEGDRREVYLCKVPPLNEARRQQFPAMKIFTREMLAYTQFLPIMFAYQEEKGVSREDGFFSVPKCYHAECNEEAEEAVIIMEDLRLDGYRMWDKMVPVNYEHARMTMEQLGRLHAVSMALRRDRPEEFESFKVPDPMKIMMPEGGPFEGMMRQMIVDAIETLEPHETTERTKMQKLLDNMRTELENCSKPDLAEPYTVLGHGDCWVNNFMFHYKNGAPDKIILLDWQITRYVTPVLDLVYFLFCCTDEEFRRRHYDEMMSVYYNALSTLLEKLGHNPQEVFPRTALMRQLRRFGRFGILMAVFLVPMLCTRNEDLPDMDKAAEKFRETQNVDINHFTAHANKSAYHKRMSAVIRDIVRYGYL